MTRPITIAGISGSLRQGSFNTAALQAAAELAPDKVTVNLITLHDIEPFSEDTEAEGWPDGVAALREKVAPVDGILFATPEYNYSIPGVLKNAIDWLSRPTGKGPITGKPAAIIGASPSPFGTARAQAHLRQIVFYNAMPLLPYDEVLVMKAGNKIEDGRLVDEESRDFVKELMADFADWVRLHTERQAG